MSECIQCWVSGLVQGVFFRASARTEAQRLGLRGYARNLPDGRVEVVACGAPESVEAMRQWLRRGPPQARVGEVTCRSYDGPVSQTFSIR